MKKTIVTLAAIALGFAGVAQAAGTSVVGSKHDLRTVATGLTEVCVTCHTPHQAAAANKQYPLWNHTGTATATFTPYDSPTINASPKPANIGGAPMGSQTTSLLCMGCHDGTVSVLSMYNPPNGATINPIASGNVGADGKLTGTPNVGTDLSNDHPVNFTYNTALATADGGLKDPATTPAVTALLFSGTVQCTSCHDVHNPQYSPFLVKDNTASALCTTCHTK